MKWVFYSAIVYGLNGEVTQTPAWEGTPAHFATPSWVVKKRHLSPTVSRWFVRRWGKPEILAYAETGEEGKEMAELLQAESTTESVAPVTSKLFEGMEWFNNVLGYKTYCGKNVADYEYSWVVEPLKSFTAWAPVGTRPLPCPVDRWIVRKWNGKEILAYAETAEEGKEFAEVLQAEQTTESLALDIVGKLLQ